MTEYLELAAIVVGFGYLIFDLRGVKDEIKDLANKVYDLRSDVSMIMGKMKIGNGNGK